MISPIHHNLYIHKKTTAMPFSGTVSFGSINVDKQDAENLRNIPNQCCACCGKPVISSDEYNSLTKKDFQGPATQVLKKLQPYSRYMRKTEKTVFNLLKRTASKYPEEDLRGLVQKRYSYHITRLEAKQILIINNAINQNLNLSEKSKIQLEKTKEKVNQILFVEPKEIPQKRMRIIKEFYELKKKCKEKQEIDKIVDKLNSLPNSINDVDAFMIKYAQRSNSEIGHRLLRTARPSLDHIEARKNNGKDEFSNLIVLCEKCNQERGYVSYNDFFITHPKMPKYIKKNLYKVLREIKEGRLFNFDTYPQDIQETLDKVLSPKNKINFDI